MSSKSSWAKVKSDMHDDEKIENIACEYGARTLAYWIVFICESKKVHRTRGGWSGPWTITQFAAKCYDEKSTKKSVRTLVERFVQEGLLEVTGELTGRWRARPSMFIALQEQGDNAVRKENSRDFLQGKDSNSHVFVTKENAKNNQKKGHRIEIEIENENEKKIDQDLSKSAPLNAETATGLPSLDFESNDSLDQDLPSTRQTIRNQMLQAPKRLGSLFPTVQRLHQMADNDLSDKQILQWYYRPAINAVAEYGSERVRLALMEAFKHEAYRWAYVKKILESDTANRAASQTKAMLNNPLAPREFISVDHELKKMMNGGAA